jgi:integrase/recombinase XerD
MACLLKRNNGIFYIVTCKKEKRMWVSLRTKSDEEARQAFEVYLEAEKRKRALFLSMYAQDFQQRAVLNLSKPTIELYGAAFRNFVRHCGDLQIKNITPLHVEKFKLLRSKEVRAVTVNIDLRTLRAAFNEALRLKIVTENPFQNMRTVRVPPKEGAFLAEGDIPVLLANICDTKFKHLVKFLIYTMLRRGELIHLEWTDIDMVRREIKVRHKKDFRAKGGKERNVPMSDWVYEFLRDRGRTSNYVFSDSKNLPLLGGTISQKFKKIVRQAKLDDAIHFHSLRHTGISILVNRGVPQEYIRRIAGHSSVMTTQIYTHIEEKSLFSAINAFPNFN